MPSRPVILCAGSLHHDVIVDAPTLPRSDQTLAGSSVRYAFGGKGGSQAAAAARAGAEVHMAGAVGSDDAAMLLRSALDNAGVRRSGVQTHPGPSGMSVAISLPDGASGAVIVSGANRLLRPDAVQFPKDCAALLLQSEIAEPANLALAGRAREAGLRVLLNATPASPVASDLLSLTDLLVVNRAEAAALLGRPEARLDVTRAAEDLARLGPQAVIVTLGGDGLVIAEAGRLILQPAHPVKVISTHGAGDAFIGALATEWARGVPLVTATAFGQAAAGLHVSLPVDKRQMVDATMIRAALNQA
jgi:ribokinase